VVNAEEPSLGPRQMSRLRIIEALYRHPLSSRADLARHTELSRATVSTLVEELVRAGLVEEAAGSGPAGAGAEGGVGRPPVLLSLVSGAAFALGLDFGHQHIRVALCDLSGEPVVDDYSLAEVDHAPSESLDLAQRLVHEALHSAGVAPDRLLGVGMGLARRRSTRQAATSRPMGSSPAGTESALPPKWRPVWGSRSRSTTTRTSGRSERKRSGPPAVSTIWSTSACPQTPLHVALLGNEVGAVVAFNGPGGQRKVKVLDFRAEDSG
jgi:hypothetical protein